MADEQIVTSIVAKADLSSLVSEVHRASASLQQLQRELLASNRAISSSTKLANNLFRDTLTGSGQYSSHFVNLNSDVDKFGKNLDSGRLKLKNYFQTFREHATTQKGMIRELAKEQVMLQNSVLQPLGRNAQGLMQYNVMIPRGLDAIANSGKLARMEMQIMNRALSEGAGSLINWGKNTQWAGRQLTVGLTVPLTMFGAAAGKAFREADVELVRLTKVYGGLAATSAAELKRVREEVVETAKTLSKTMGASFKDTIALGADIAATGQTGNELLGSIQETTRLSILGEVDRQDAMKATLSIQTAFKQNTKELTESINFLNAVENQTSTTLGDLVEAIPKAGPVIQQLGGDVKDLALYLTAMREGGINASEGANALKSGLASLINPTKQTVGMMSDFGIDVMGMVARNTGDTTGLLMDLQKALDSLDPLSKARAMEQMFGKFQFARMSALLNNLGKEGSQTLQVLNLMKATTGELADVASRELKMITESASGKYKRAIEGLKAELADVGEEFLGVATKLITAATKILDFFTGLPAPIKKALTFLAGFTALVGPLIMLTGVLANFFGYITKGVVQLRAFFMKANGWKMLTPEIIAAQKAAEMVETAFYSDAAAAQVLHNALQKLVLDYQSLQAASAKNAIPVNPGMSTVGGAPVMVAGRRMVDPTDPYVGDVNTRAMSHINPRDPNNPATIFGGVPGAVPVNRGISRTPQIYMHDRLPNVEGLTSIKGISTGIVPGEAAKHHALMATLGMQSQQEIAALKKTIAMGGTVSRELLDTFDDILPITQRFADSAATQSAAIVQQMRNAEITVEQAKARILALNAQIEADMGAAVSMYAAGRGRTIDLTRAPMMDQPVVDANGQFTLRDLYKKKANLSVMNEFGRLRGVRTFGAPYSIQTTRPPRFNTGGEIESFGPSKTIVSGPSSIDYDDRLGSVPLGGYVLNQSASMDPANAALVAMAPSTYLNDGGSITAALTPRETVFGPEIQRMPELYAAVDAANSGYNFGGQIMRGVAGYGKKTSNTPGTKMDERLFKKQYKEYLRFINNPRYEDDMRVRMIMLDAAELSYTAKMPMDQAIKTATSNFDSAKIQSGGSDEKFVKIRIKQVQDLEKKHKQLRVKNATTSGTSSSKALNYNLNKVRDAMLKDKSFAGVHDLIKDVSPTTFKNGKGMPIIQGLHDRAHFRRRGTLGYMTSGYMGLAAVMPSGINNIMSRLETLGLSRDVLNLNAADARENFALALKKTGMDRFATVDDLYAAVMDDGKFKTKAQIESGNVIRANKKQRSSWSMFLEAAATRQKWVPGRPPRLVPAGYNLGGMIPGGSISRQRKSYGNPMSLLAPEKMLKILTKAKELSSRGALGSFSSTPVTKYGHQIAASSGMSYPIPGVSGVYRDPTGKLVFVKGVPNELTAIHEPIGTTIMRNAFGINAPVQTARTITNPLDPSKKSKLLALESDFDPRFVSTNVPWKEDQVIRQLAGSLLMNNKDLSRSNVFGNFNPDVGNAGVFAKASGNTAIATEMNSMEKQAMINLLAVRGGARKDFARDTAPIVRKMSPKKYGRLMKKALEDARPELVKIIEGLPKEIQGPYIAMLKRLDDGIDVDWSKYHAVHANPTYLNSGGPVGGAVRQGRYSYGKKGNPAARAAQAKARAARTASYNPSSGSSYTASGNPQMQVARVPYVGGTGVAGNVYAGVPTASMARTVSTMRLAQFPHMSMPTMPMNIPGIGNTAAISAAFKSMGNSIKVDSMQLAKAIKFNAQYIAMSTKENAQSLINATKSMSARVVAATKTQALKMQAAGTGFYQGIIQQQNAFAAKHYPAGMAPPQGLMGPGYIGRYKDLGDGVQSRKVGSVGFRKTEYLVNNASTGGHSVSMSAAQARAAGVQVPQRQGMGMGMGMGIGMAGSMAGMTLMGKEKVKILGTEMSGMSAGMGVMAASSILPFLPLTKFLTAAKAGAIGLGKGLKTIQMGALTLTKIFAGVMRFVKGFGPIGVLITIATAAFSLYKHFKDESQDATMGLSQTARAAEEAGIKYFNLKEQMQGYLDKQQAIRAAGQAAKSNGIGMPGLPQSVEDIKKAKEEGKELKDLIESINRSASPEESKRLLSSTKAQYVAGGMSVEEANRKIYGALLNSKKSMEAYDLLGNSAFGKITDKSTAAEFAVGNLINTINKGSGMVDWGKEITAGFEGLINTFEAARAGLVGTKDEMGNVIDEYKAYELVMASSEKMYPGFNDAIGNEVYENLAATQPILAGISNEADSLKGILAKYALFTDQIGIDLSKIDSGLAIKLAGFTEAVGSGIAQLTKAGDGATTYSTVGSALEKLKRTIGSVSAATQRSAAAAQRSAQEELKLIAKKIKLIDDEKNKKLEALRATQEASNYALELQKLQIEYADAVSRGDMATANRAKLDIDQLTLNRQSELAQKAIEDAANAAKAPLEKKATGIQDASDKKTVALQIAQENAAIASEMASKLTTFQMQYNDLTQRAVQSQFLPDKERKIEEDKIKDSLVALIKEIQVAGTGNTALAKAVQSGFSKYFDDKGKPVAPTVTTPTSGYSGFDKNGKPIYNTSTTINPNILTQFNKDIAAVTNIAEDITKGTSLDRLRIDLLKALGYKDKTAGISAFSTGVAITPGTLGKKGQKGVAQTTVNQLTGEKEYLQEGYFSASPLSFIGGGRNLQPGTILQVGPKGSVIALSMGSLGIKKSGSIRIESVDYNASPPTLIWTVNKAAGGHITGAGTGTSDSIPAMLSNGEYVVKASSVAKYGVETLNALNAQKLHKGGPVFADPQPAVDYTPLPSTPISKLGKSTQAQIKYLTDWTNLLNTYYAAKYKDVFNFKPGEKIASALNVMPVFKGTKLSKDPHQSLIDSDQYGAYYRHDDASITMGLAQNGTPRFIPNPIHDPYTMKDLNQSSSFPYSSKGMSPVNYIESISKDAQKNPYGRMEILNTLFHEFAHAIQFKIKGYIKNSQASRGLTDVGDPNKPTPGFLNIESGADLMAGGIFQEMYSNGYIPQIKKSVIDTLLKSKILTASYGDEPTFDSSDPSSEDFTWHPYNNNFRFKSVMTGMRMGDSAAFDDTLTLRKQRLTQNGGVPLTFAELGNTAAAIAAITPDMIPKGFHKGGPVGHRHGRNLPGSLFRWNSYPEDMPDYWSDGSPSGSPYTQRWGALRYGPAKGKDIWGGTEIPGLRFDGKIPNRSDYWHQIAEQPSKTRGYGGMGIDEELPRYAGSGASMSGIGNGVYGPGSWLTYANGGPVGYHKGGKVGHKHDVNPITKAFRFFKNAMNNGTNPGSAMIMDVINQAGYLGQLGLSGMAKGIVPKPTKEQDKSFQEFTGIPMAYRALAGKTDEGPVGKLDPTAGKITDWAGLLTFFTPWRSSGRMATNAAAQGAVKAAVPTVPLSPMEMFRSQFPSLDPSTLPKGTVSTGPKIKPWEMQTYKKILARHYLAKLPDPRTLTQHEVAVLADMKVPGFEGLRVHTEHTADYIADDLKLKSTFNYNAPLTKSISTVEEILGKSLFHGGDLPIVDGKIDLKNRTGLNSWYGGQMFAAEDYKQALAYLMKSPDNSIYSITSALKKEDIIDLRHNANTLASQQPYVFAKLLRDIESGKIALQDHQSKDFVYSTLLAQEGGRYPHAAASGALRDKIFQLYFKDISPWLAENGIKAIIHRNGTRVAIPEIGTSVTDNPTRVQDFSQPGTDAIAYTTVDSSIGKIEKHTITSKMVQDLIARLGKGELPSTLESQILAMLRNSTSIPHKALGGLMKSSSMRIPKFDAGHNMVPADMLAMIHKNEAVIPAHMNPFNPNATSSAMASGSVYNINVELNGTTVTAKDVAMEIHREMRIKEMAAGVNRTVGRP